MPTVHAAKAEQRERLSAALSRSLEEHGRQTWWHQAGLDCAWYLLDKLIAYDVIAPEATCVAAGLPSGSTYGHICWSLGALLRDLLKERERLSWRERLAGTTDCDRRPKAGSMPVASELVATLQKALQSATVAPWWEPLGLGTAQALTGELWASRDRAPDALCEAAGMAPGTTFSALARKLRAELPRQEMIIPAPASTPDGVPAYGVRIEDLMAECSLRLRRLHVTPGTAWWEEYGAMNWWRLTAKLWSCTRVAPTAACRVLGMPVRSTFAQLARVMRTDLRYRAPVQDYSPTKKKPRGIPADVTGEAIEDMPETFGTVTVSVLLGVPYRTVAYWVERGWLSADRAARGYWEIHRESLQEFLRLRPWAVEWRMTAARDE